METQKHNLHMLHPTLFLRLCFFGMVAKPNLQCKKQKQTLLGVSFSNTFKHPSFLKIRLLNTSAFDADFYCTINIPCSPTDWL